MQLFAARGYVFACCLAVAATPGVAQGPRPTIFDIPLGAEASMLPPSSEFGIMACGNDGGPPGKVLAGWSQYRDCPAGREGWHEVYFEYDDEAEYVARAHED